MYVKNKISDLDAVKSFPGMSLVSSQECLLSRVNHPGAAHESKESYEIQRESPCWKGDELLQKDATVDCLVLQSVSCSAVWSSGLMDRRDAVFRSTREQTKAETVLSSGLEMQRASWRMAQYRLLVTSVYAHFIFIMHTVNLLLSTFGPNDDNKKKSFKNPNYFVQKKLH